MNKIIEAIYENGVITPLEDIGPGRRKLLITVLDEEPGGNPRPENPFDWNPLKSTDRKSFGFTTQLKNLNAQEEKVKW